MRNTRSFYQWKRSGFKNWTLAATAVLLPLHCIVASKSGYPAHLVSPTHLETSRKVPPNVFVDHTVNHGRKIDRNFWNFIVYSSLFPGTLLLCMVLVSKQSHTGMHKIKINNKYPFPPPTESPVLWFPFPPLFQAHSKVRENENSMITWWHHS